MFGKARKVLIEKKREIEIWVVKNIILLDFDKFLSYSEMHKDNRIVNV